MEKTPFLTESVAVVHRGLSTPSIAENILFVDDEANVLEALQRSLHTRFCVSIAVGPEQGLEIMSREGPFAVVVSDLRMPGMDGINFLAEVKVRFPDTVRVLLTGQADLSAAIAAVNQGHIFRFLQKPCEAMVLDEVLQASLDQYHWIIEEHQRAAALASCATELTDVHCELATTKEAAQMAETARKQSESRFRSTFEEAPIGICLLDADGKVVEGNRVLQQMLGLSKEELKTIMLIEVAHPDDRARVEEHFHDLATGRCDRFQAEERYRRKGGDFGWARLTVCCAQSSGCWAIAMAEDISEHKRLEEQFLHSQKMDALGRLAAGVAHDFNNLLTVILGNTELAAESAGRSTVQYGNLDEIRQAADRARSLVNQLLMFSRKQFVERRTLDLNVVVSEFEKMLRHLIGEDIDFVVQPAPVGLIVQADRMHIEQVLLNLAVNARDAMPNGGSLTLKMAAAPLAEPPAEAPSLVPGEYAVLTVEDTGTGMGSDVCSRIFEPFFTTKGSGKGTGLGLSTVHDLVQQCNGHIAVESQVGKGTQFTVYLPMTRATGACDAVLHPNERRLGSGETVLVVEDEDSVRTLLCRILEARGYCVLSAGNSMCARTLARQARIQLLVTDVLMPGMNGRDLAKELATEHGEMRVLYVSGYDEHASSVGGAFLRKPFTPEELLTKVREVLEHPAVAV